MKNRKLPLSSAHSLIRTVKTTKNFWTASTLMCSNGRKKVIFRNGSVFSLNLDEYVSIRDFISTGSKVYQVGSNLFRIKNSKYELVVSGEALSQVRVMLVIHSRMYSCDCLDKIVLDVGGLEGETVAVFSGMGAKKIIVYEPVKAHHDLIRQNVLLNGIEAELHEESIGNADGTQTVQYETADASFGILSKGSHTMNIRIRSITTVIAESHADVAKFNCEGAEESLIHVSDDIIRKIDFYIVEVHSYKIRNGILRKFTDAGFSLMKDIHISGEISVLHFKKLPI